MELLSTPHAIQTKLINLFDQCKKVYFSVAWATENHEFFNRLKSHPKRIALGVVGLDFYQTSPNFIRQFANHSNITFVSPNSKGVFHPKTYVFELKDRYALIVGSANMTTGGLTKNQEICVVWYTDKDDLTSQSLIDTLQSFTKLKSQKIDDAWLTLYTEQVKAHERARKKIAGSKKANEVEAILPDLNINIDWSAFSKKVKEDKYTNSFKERIELLDRCQSLLTRNSLKDMDYADRRLIAGLKDKKSEFDSGWFGSLEPNGVVKQIIKDHSDIFSNALDQIPLSTAITRIDFDNFCRIFEKEFSAQAFEREPSIISLSRFLCMKRPDFFSSINKKNFSQLSAALGFKKRLTSESYWELIQLIHQQPWYKTKVKKEDPDYSLWKYRAAMLDAIYYEH